MKNSKIKKVQGHSLLGPQAVYTIMNHKMTALECYFPLIKPLVFTIEAHRYILMQVHPTSMRTQAHRERERFYSFHNF